MTYSNDLKSRALNAYYKCKKSCKCVCETFSIDLKTFYSWRKKVGVLSNKGANVINYNLPKKPTKRMPKKNPKYSKQLMKYIERYVNNKCNFRIWRLIKLIEKRFNIKLKPRNIYYILKIQNMTYKKAKYRVIKKKSNHKQKVKQLKKNIIKIGFDEVISVDESHFEINMMPSHGWSKKGNATIFHKKSSDRKRITLISAISNKRVVYYEMHEGSVDAKIYLQFLKKLNRKCRNKKYLMDNARTHHSKIVKEHMKNVSNEIIYNVPYNPETNPIEQQFGVIKADVIKRNTETIKLLKKAIDKSINNIPKEYYANFYRHSFES